MENSKPADLPLHEELRHAAHGDLRPLIKLLRSRKPLPSSIRDYLADELEKPTDKRFRRAHKQDLGNLKRRRELIARVELAKAEIASRSLPENPTPQELEAGVDRLGTITDREALDYLQSFREEIDPVDLANARRAIGPSVSNRSYRKLNRDVS